MPAIVASPYAKPNAVTNVVHDHTSVLKLIETKWNLGALTYRDANADNLLDSIDFSAKAFMDPPTLPAPALPAAMLFVRSPGGLSHHPEEAVLAEDVEVALATGMELLRGMSAARGEDGMGNRAMHREGVEDIHA